MWEILLERIDDKNYKVVKSYVMKKLIVEIFLL